MDNKITAGLTSTGQLEGLLKELKDHVNATNKEFAARLGINVSAATTTVKPSGTVSQLVDSGSGIHARYASFYLRTVRADKKDPVSLYMRAMGVYAEDDVTKPHSTDVFYFPQKAPDESVTRTEVTALDQLAHYLIYKRHWCEHNPSITVYVKEDEWMKVGSWVYDNFNDIGGIAFLPYSEHIYRQAPYQEITKEEYYAWKAKTPITIDWGDLREGEDNTTGSQEYACVGNSCEVS
jgi:ribonucleoside-diphosphate reductase alpha chain